MPYDTRELFARLLQCEAGGEGDNGMAAVAAVGVSTLTTANPNVRPVVRGAPAAASPSVAAL